MSEEKKLEAPEEAKGLADKLLQILGPVDLVMGGLALYWLRLWFGPSIPTLFPSTGQNALDIALLACGAAFVGKAITLLASYLIGLTQLLIQRKWMGYSALEASLRDYLKSKGRDTLPTDVDLIEQAAQYASVGSPQFQSTLLVLETNSLLGYSFVPYAVLFARYLFRMHAPLLLWLALLVGAVFSLLSAIEHQKAYLIAIQTRLNALALENPGAETSPARKA